MSTTGSPAHPPIIARFTVDPVEDDKSVASLVFWLSRDLTEAEERSLADSWWERRGWDAIQIDGQEITLPEVAISNAEYFTKGLVELLAKLPEASIDWQTKIDAREKQWADLIDRVSATIRENTPLD